MKNLKEAKESHQDASSKGFLYFWVFPKSGRNNSGLRKGFEKTDLFEPGCL